MEKVERRAEKGRRRRCLLWVAGGTVLLSAAIFAALRMNPPAPPAPVSGPDESRGSIENRKTEEITSVSIGIKGRETWTAIRGTDGKLRLEDSSGWTLDETLGNRIEDAMANIVYEAILSEDPEEYQDHLEDFGLKDPELVATAVYADGETVTLRFGKTSGLADKDFRYMTVDGDSRLYAAASSLMDDLMVEAELLRPVDQPEVQTSRLDRITVMNGDGTVRAEWRLKGNIFDTDAAENWYLTVPEYYPADYDVMVNLKKNAGNLRMGIWVGEATEDNLAAYGLLIPSAILEIHLAAGTTGQISEDGTYTTTDWEESAVRIEIGSARNDLTDYVRWGNQIYTMNRFTLETLTEARPLETVARYTATVALEVLSSMTVETDQGTTVYRLMRDGTDEEEANGTTVRCLKNGIEIPYSSFEAAYERWLVVTVSGKLPEKWEKRESNVKYTFCSVSGMEHTLELSEFDALHDAVTLDGCTLFYLIREGIPELP